MGKSLEEWLAQAQSGASVGVTLVTNQDNGIASYASGSLLFHPAALIGPILRPARLSTTGGTPLKYHFSDRLLDIDPPSPPGSFGHTPRQPFSANATDQLGLSISVGPLAIGGRVAKFTLHSWGNATFSVILEAREHLMVGVGPPVGNHTAHAVYVLSFNGVSNPPH